MLYPEGLMHRKINFGLALLIIAILAGIFAVVISAKAVVALGGSGLPSIGVSILTPPIKCTPDPDAPTCLITCPVCGDLPGCQALFEIHAEYLSGTMALYKGLAFCTAPPYPMNGGSFTPGAQCLGNVFGYGPHLLENFGCSAVSGFF